MFVQRTNEPTLPLYQRLQPRDVAHLKSRSTYGQQAIYDSHIDDISQPDADHVLFQCFRTSNVSRFVRLYNPRAAQETRITNLMATLFSARDLDVRQLDTGALQFTDARGRTALHWTVAGKVQPVSKTLVQRVARPLVGCQDEDGVTALMVALQMRSYEWAEWLVQNGEAAIRDAQGHSWENYCLDAAALCRVKKTLQLQPQSRGPAAIRQFPLTTTSPAKPRMTSAALFDQLAAGLRVSQRPPFTASNLE